MGKNTFSFLVNKGQTIHISINSSRHVSAYLYNSNHELVASNISSDFLTLSYMTNTTGTFYLVLVNDDGSVINYIGTLDSISGPLDLTGYIIGIVIAIAAMVTLTSVIIIRRKEIAKRNPNQVVVYEFDESGNQVAKPVASRSGASLSQKICAL